MAPLQFGVLMVPYQVTDVSGPLDILSNASKQFLNSPSSKSIFRAEFEADPTGKDHDTYVNIGDRGIDIEFHHIGPTMEPVILTGGYSVNPTTTAEKCPPLDYLIVGGPDPAENHLTPEFVKLLKEHVAAGKGLFLTCTGALAVAPSGILDGKKATTNHACLGFAKAHFPKTIWQKDQWVIDGNIWSAGGACAGMDMFAAWVRKNCDADVAEITNKMLDFQPRGLDKKFVE